MNTSAKATVFILIAGSLWGWSQSSPSSAVQPSVSEIAANFTNYSRMTKGGVSVDPELAMLCVGLSRKNVEAERIKFGPHAFTWIQIYMNKLAADSFTTNSHALFPVGAVIVKQKTIQITEDQDGNRVRQADTGVGGMVKRPAGYDPKHGDWEYFYFEDAAKIESGRISSCVQCHASAADKDYVFGTWSSVLRSHF